jgi:acyl carrier protein
MSTTTALDKDDLRATIAEVLDVDESDITDDASFIDDLEFDSLMALEVMVNLERKYGVKLGESELRQVTSLQTAYELLGRKLGGTA